VTVQEKVGRSGFAVAQAGFAPNLASEFRPAGAITNALLAEIANQQSFALLGNVTWTKIALANVSADERAKLDAAYTARRLFLADRLTERAS
jgi:hypothetical protein